MSFLAFTKGKKISAKIAARQRCGAENQGDRVKK
jgi:hypothetical protein